MVLGVLCVVYSCQKEPKIKNVHPAQEMLQHDLRHGSNLLSDSFSYWIQMSTANDLIDSYLNGINSSSDTLIKSFLLDAASMRHYLLDSSIQQFKLILAHTAHIEATSPDVYHGLKAGSITCIIVGVDALGNYVYRDGDLVVNRMLGCPHNCLSVGSAANDLLVSLP